MTYQESFVEVIDTNLTKKPSTPQLVIKNPLSADIFLNSIQLSFDSYFSEKGMIMIKVNNNIILNQKVAGAYKRIHNFPIPLKNQEFLQQQKIEVFAWNGSGDNDLVSVGLDIQISEDPNLSVAPDTPLSETMRNQAISESEILFEKMQYSDEIVTKLLNMKGYKKMIVNISSASTLNEMIFSDFGSPENIVDGDVNSKSSNGTLGTGTFPSGESPKETRVDFNSKKLRNLSVKFEAETTSNRNSALYGILKVKVFISDDDIIYTQIGDDNFTYFGNNVLTSTKDYGDNDYRYVKIILENFDDGDGDVRFNNKGSLYEIFDNSLIGGTVSLSFEELDIADNSFSDLIPSSEFGTISSGAKVKIEIGDVNNVSSSGKTYFLPSTQTGLRAKLTITGSIDTGVSIRRIA